MYNIKSNVKLLAWVTMMCQCRFTNCNKHTTLAEDVHNGGDCACVGLVGIQNISVPFS